MCEVKELEIYFSDFNAKGKKKILNFYDIKTAKEGNLDILPLDTLYVGEDN